MLGLEWASLNTEWLRFFLLGHRRGFLEACQERAECVRQTHVEKPPELEGQLIAFPFCRLHKQKVKRATFLAIICFY